jgi:hypothetical protein
MGLYIQTGELFGKAEEIIKEHDAERLVAPPDSFEGIPEGKALIVVVENSCFDAAGFAHNPQEFRIMTDVGMHDSRPRTYLLMDRKLAEKLTNYKEYQ